MCSKTSPPSAPSEDAKQQNMTSPCLHRWLFPNRGVEPRATAVSYGLVKLIGRRICYPYQFGSFDARDHRAVVSISGLGQQEVDTVRVILCTIEQKFRAERGKHEPS